MALDLSPDQKEALNTLISWYKDKNKNQFITLGGFAGTGKTTLISLLRQELNKINKDLKIAFVSYTGKATRVMKSKLVEQNTIQEKDSVSTIHSLIYSPMVNDKEEIIGWERRSNIEYDLIIVDEASMVDSEIWRDLLTYRIPIIAVGDHGQLPPIRGSFNLMEKPMIRLEQIHRQAEDNPIIELSIMARTKGEIPVGNYGGNVMKISKQDSETREIIGELLSNYKKDLLVLCGYNTTRVKLNQYIRNALEFFDPFPKSRDRVICLRNNHQKLIYNGMLGNIVSINSEIEDNDGTTLWYNAEIEMDGEGENYKGLIYAKQFNSLEPNNFTDKRSQTLLGDLFDFGYALTVHKAQGSQAKRVVLFEERFKQMDEDTWKRWLYTGITRAEEELFIVGS
jgi:exodeoxyribonuclease-5